MERQQAEGWYVDPYEIHQDRWMSAGQPTKLVRDGRTESYDPPPDHPMPPGELIPAEAAGGVLANGSDLRRADDPASDPARALNDMFTIFDQSSGAT